MSIKTKISGDSLRIEFTGLSVLWTLKRAIQFPLKNILGATFDPNSIALPKGFRSPGLHVPKILTAGSYSKDGERQFWFVSSGRNAVVLRLKNEKYSQVVIEVPNPQDLVSKINSSID